jgi:ribonuclease T1
MTLAHTASSARAARRTGAVPRAMAALHGSVTWLALLLVIATLLLSACASTTGGSGPGAGDPAAASAASGDPAGLLDARFATAPPPDWEGSTISLEELPPEAQVTLRLIAAGGPFPYDQDGSTFQNREGLLPAGPEGAYAEYTVETPGSVDRGARRLVVGEGGYVYYTDDHYDSFRFVAP